MKKIITTCLLLITLTVFGQEKETKSLIDKTKEAVAEYVDYDTALKNIDNIEDLFVHYFKEATEGTKALIGSGVEVAEKAVTLLIEESTIIVRQYIIYTSISHLLPIIFGGWLIFWLPKLISKKLTINTDEAIAYNKKIDADKSTYKKPKKPTLSGKYFNDKISMASHSVGTYIAYLCGLFLIFINTMPFIKVTFFSKLYLVEMLLKHI